MASMVLLMLLAMPQSAMAQVKIGMFSNKTALESMPAYKTAQADLQRLKEQYDQEIKRAEEEFNSKYEDFLENVNTLAPSIRRKRQAELQQYMESNMRFREETKRLLKQAENDAIAPLQQRINTTLRIIAAEQGYDVIINTDSNAVPFISSAISEDINMHLQNALSK